MTTHVVDTLPTRGNTCTLRVQAQLLRTYGDTWERMIHGRYAIVHKYADTLVSLRAITCTTIRCFFGFVWLVQDKKKMEGIEKLSRNRFLCFIFAVNRQIHV